MKKKLFVSLLIVLLFVTFIGVQNADAKESLEEKKLLKMATNSTFPPYEYVDGGKIVGIDVEIAAEIANRLGYDLKIMDMEFNTIISSIESGKADIGIAGMTVTKERERSVNFSSPYAKSVQQIIVNKNSEIKTPDDLTGKKIGTQLGTTGDIFAKEDFGENAVQSFDKHADAIMALKSNKIDLVMIDDMTAKAFLRNNNDLKMLDSPYAEEEYAIAVNIKNTDLLNKINGVINDMQKDKSLDKIIAKYIASKSDENTIKKGEVGILNEIEKNLLQDNLWKYLVRGLKNTLIITFFSLLIGFVLGLVFSLVKLVYHDLTPDWKSPRNILLNILYRLINILVSFIRGTPTMIQLLIMFNVILAGVKNLSLVAILTFGINSAAYMSEIFRGGFNSVNKGEIEAARALGLTYYQTFMKIVLPQSMKLSLPALGNETITLLKETSIAGAIGLMDLTRGANIIISHTFSAFIPYIATALIYYVFVLLLEYLFKNIEGKMSYVKN